MHVLEARFHPDSKGRPGFVVVGRVICDQKRAAIVRLDVAPETVKPFDATKLHEKLDFIVMAVVGDPFRALQELRSGFWSFVEIEGAK